MAWENTNLLYILCPELEIERGPSLTEATKLVATDRKASSGHSLNQSMVQQFTSEGNIRNRVRKASPKGLMAMTMWRLVLHWSTKYIYNSGIEPSRPAFLARARTISKIGIISSLGYKLGTCKHVTSEHLSYSSKVLLVPRWPNVLIKKIHDTKVKGESCYFNRLSKLRAVRL